jgi:ribosomal protein S18 acetylase RimI-like enzyme
VTDVVVRPLDATDEAALRAFFARVPEGDRTFFREDVLAPGVIEGWFSGAPGERFVACSEGDVVGYLALIPAVGWSSHVGELRVVVDPTRRRTGVGRALARHGFLRGVENGLTKLVVEVVADQESAIGLFAALGFEAEALLRDHVRDTTGEFRDLIVMAHFVEAVWEQMRTVGIDEVIAD